MTIELGPDESAARRQATAITTFMLAVGRQLAELRRERLVFLEQRARFASAVRRAQAQDRRAR